MNIFFKATKIKLIEYAIDILFNNITKNFRKIENNVLKIGDEFEEIIHKASNVAYLDCKIMNIHIPEMLVMITYRIRANIVPTASYDITATYIEHQNTDTHLAAMHIELATFNKCRTIVKIIKLGTARIIAGAIDTDITKTEISNDDF